MAQQRHDGRKANELRETTVILDFVRSAGGSCLIELGGTRVICTASFEAGVPTWREKSGLGWVTAEYAMMPASTGPRRKARGTDSRATEIKRLIGRALRGVVDFEKLGPNTITLDCDVLEADGGTRCVSITGAYIALARAVERGAEAGLCRKTALNNQIAAVSVGIVDGRAVLDLDYAEDSSAEVDMNVAMVRGGKFVELQGTSEGVPFEKDQLDKMLTLAGTGIRKLMKIQRDALKA
ncbi:MAG: ribonuclease PH [Phycisphaerae bacterium]